MINKIEVLATKLISVSAILNPYCPVISDRYKRHTSIVRNIFSDLSNGVAFKLKKLFRN